MQAALFAKLGIAVMTTVAVVCMPFLVVPGGMHAVISRVFPTQRGLFEDYVANFWWVLTPYLRFQAHYKYAAYSDLVHWPLQVCFVSSY